MKPVYVEAVGLAAPGMASWRAAQPILTGASEWADQTETLYQPQSLPPNERRRATPSVRMAFRVAEDARSGSGLDFAGLPSIFASADADMGIIHRICTALTEPDQLVSPTDFHNSVHNAPSGYWSIATCSRQATSSIAGYDGSFATGLLEAATWVATEMQAVLLVAFDLPPPPPLFEKRPIRTAAGVSLVLSAQPLPGSIAELELSLVAAPETGLSTTALETLRTGNPALRSLPLLRQLATATSGSVSLPYNEHRRLRVGVRPR